ncbi:MAG: type II toxin-antitoxin system HicA family toxin [Mariprofundales bacterium]|nr:type II toxin-antitoxin system HicA family toxin [Mariprofundales bacterium]
MGKHDKLIRKIMLARSDANIAFTDLIALLLAMGFRERVRGSHHLFTRSDVVERVNLQRDGSKVKPYQVRQVRAILSQYGWRQDNA